MFIYYSEFSRWAFFFSVNARSKNKLRSLRSQKKSTPGGITRRSEFSTVLFEGRYKSPRKEPIRLIGPDSPACHGRSRSTASAYYAARSCPIACSKLSHLFCFHSKFIVDKCNASCCPILPDKPGSMCPPPFSTLPPPTTSPSR